MNKKIFLGLILTSIIVISLIALTGCVDPQKNPLIPTYNNFPRLGELNLHPAVISSLATTTLSVTAVDVDGDDLKITFREGQNRGTFQITSSTTAIWTAPMAVDDYDIYAKVEDINGAAVEGFKTVRVVNNKPVVDSVTGDPAYINYTNGDTSLITVVAYDVDYLSDLAITCGINNTDTISGTVVLQTSTKVDSITTTVFLFTISTAPGFHDVFFDVTATDDMGATTTDSPLFRIQTGVL